MSKSIASLPVSKRSGAVARRIASESKGLGYWGAIDALRKVLVKAPKGEKP